MTVPISKTTGIELLPASPNGVVRVRVSDSESRQQLSWDRYVRIQAVAKAIENERRTASLSKGFTVLDVGGFDGALAFFLENCSCSIDLTDPATTGIEFFDVDLPPHSYDVVTAIDVLEHINPERRSRFLEKVAESSRHLVLLNYPHVATRQAQEVVLQATNNTLIREHVEWDLPDDAWVMEQMSRYGYGCHARAHNSLAVWLGQYVLLNAAPEKAAIVNKFLLNHCVDEPFTLPLYSMIICRRSA